jgi:isoleucyl-tRNA synthetase
VRLNRDRLKGSSGELEALLGLNVLFEVLLTMSQIMSPFTPFFAEYLYQNLRKLQPLYENSDDSVPIDSTGDVAENCYYRIRLTAAASFKCWRAHNCVSSRPDISHL